MGGRWPGSAHTQAYTTGSAMVKIQILHANGYGATYQCRGMCIQNRRTNIEGDGFQKPPDLCVSGALCSGTALQHSAPTRPESSTYHRCEKWQLCLHTGQGTLGPHTTAELATTRLVLRSRASLCGLILALARGLVSRGGKTHAAWQGVWEGNPLRDTDGLCVGDHHR